MPQTQVFTRQNIVAEIEATRTILQHLEGILASIDGTPSPEPIRIESHSRNTGDLKIWKAVRNYLTEVKREASLDELARELSASGSALGRYPLRTISVAIGKMANKNVFTVTKRDSQTFIGLVQPNIMPLSA